MASLRSSKLRTLVLLLISQYVKPSEIVRACQYWRDNRPTVDFTPTDPKMAAEDYLARRKNKISQRRFKTENCYIGIFADAFKTKTLDQITSVEISDYLDAKGWAKKTRNDTLCFHWAILPRLH